MPTPKVFRQNSRPDPQWANVGDFWIDPDRDPGNAVFMCVDEVVNPDTGQKHQTYRKLVPQMSVVPPSDLTGLSLVFSGTPPERSIQLVATDLDGSTHVIAEIMY